MRFLSRLTRPALVALVASVPIGAQADCPTSNPPKIIDVSQSWWQNMGLDRGIVVRPGKTLTIHGNVQLPSNAEVVVEAGGKLVLDGGTLTTCHDTYWQGVILDGVASQGNSQSTPNGKLVMINSGRIEQAVYGVYVYPGGTVQSTDGVFRNNAVDVYFEPYRYYLSSGSEVPNRSSFVQTTFETTARLGGFWPRTHVELNDTNLIRFVGCTFRNTMPSLFQVDERGIGIYSVNARFSVQPQCTSKWCGTYNSSRFENLRWGIHASANNLMIPVDVSRAVFDNNWRGVHLSRIGMARVLENTFDVGADNFNNHVDPAAYAIHLDHSTGYRIEDNTITSSQQAEHGIWIENSGYTPNQVYRNEISFVDFGASTAGLNYKLQLLCNKFSGNMTSDILRSDLSMASSQGSCLAGKPAGNQFSHVCTYTTSDFTVSTPGGATNYAHAPTLAETPLCKSAQVSLSACAMPSQCPSMIPPAGQPPTKFPLLDNIRRRQSLLREADQVLRQNPGGRDEQVQAHGASLLHERWAITDEIIHYYLTDEETEQPLRQVIALLEEELTLPDELRTDVRELLNDARQRLGH